MQPLTAVSVKVPCTYGDTLDVDVENLYMVDVPSLKEVIFRME